MLSSGNDLLVINGDTNFSVNAGAGDDIIKVNSYGNLTATIDGGAGTNDILDLSGSGFVDLTQSTLSNIESIKYGTSTVVVTDSQLANGSFDGSGAKFTKSGSAIIGTTGNDSYSGNGTGSFQGGKGDDTISYVDTAVFTGNYADYDFTRTGNTLTVQQARGSLLDGKDTVTGVMNLKFADTTLKIDDAPDHYFNFSDLAKAEYGKAISAKKDYASDTDVFGATLAPNSPLAIDASSFKGSTWNMGFTDVATHQQIYFKSLVYGQVIAAYYNWMAASDKWLPGFNTADGFKAYQGGDVVLQVNVDGGIQDYAFTLNFLDDYAGSVNTLGQMDAQSGVVKGFIGDSGDTDWIRTNLIAGTKYQFDLQGESSGGGTLVDPKLQLLDSQGRVIESGLDLLNNSVGNDDTLVFRPTVTGTYYLSAADVAKINTGSWTLTQKSLDTIAGNISTTERIDWTGAQTFTVSSEINTLSDHDWFKVWLDKGLTYNFQAKGSSAGGTLADPQLSLRSVTGILLGQDDNSGGSADAKLVYSATDSGWYYLDAGASGNAGKGTYTLTGSTLADDYANTVLTTGIIQPGTPVHGLITYNGDSDWFKVGLSKGNTYVINLTGDVSAGAQLDPLTDPLLIIRDASGGILFKADDFGGTLDSRAYFTPTADGLYFLEAKSAFKYDIGAYQLSVAAAPADDFVNTATNTAGSLALGVASTGIIGAPGDKDMFQVSLEAGKVYQLSLEAVSGHVGTLADPYLRVFDSQGHLLDFDNNGGAGNDAQLYLAPSVTGTYYVEASAFNDRAMGTYQVSVVQRNVPADDVPNDLSTKVFLTPGDSFQGNLLTHNDQDWFGIKLEANKDYVFRTKASDSGDGSLVDPVMEIRAADGSLIKTVDNMLMSNDPATAFTPNASGTYYLVVKAANGQVDTGTYTLVTRAPDDYSNTQAGAAPINLNQTLDGGIQWSDGAYGVRAYDAKGLATDSDEDWFQFTATQDQVLSINVKMALNSTLSRPMVEIVDSQGHSVAVGDGLETKEGLAVATFKAVDAGSYYARVIDGAGATGAYQISLTAGDASDEDAQGPVLLDFVSTGAVIQAQASARIGLAGDSDNFTVGLQAGHSYRFETLAVRDGTHEPLASASLSLGYQAQGANTFSPVDIARSVATPSFFDSTVFEASTSGVMKIGVQPLDVTQTGQYKVRVIDLGVNQADDRPDLLTQYHDATDGVMAANENQAGKIDSADDVDLFAINLTAGNIYDFAIKGFADGLGTLAQGDLRLLDSMGNLVTAGAFDSQSGRTDMAVSVFADGRYYLAVSAANLPGNTGTFTLDTRLRDLSTPSTDDMSADTRSGITVAPGNAVNGKVDYAGDQDWVHASLVAGKVYVLDVLGNGNGAGGTLTDSTLRLLDAKGNEVAFDDNSGAGLDSHLQFTPETSGDYYLDVGGNGAAVGTYTLRLRELYSGVADPLKSAQWYLSALGLDKLGGQLTGAGITVGIVDDGIDTSHPDLQNQLNFALAYDTQFNTNDGQPKYPVLIGPPDNHGTAVAGIIAAQANNETGIVGIASDAKLVSTRVHWTWDQITEALSKQYQFDISNNSWGAINPFGDNFNSTALTFAYQALRTGVEEGRGGKGTVFVFSSGNSAAYGDNTNYHNFQNAREVITVAAANSDGSVAGFSTPGANILVGAYGVGLLTTDRHQPGLGYEPSSGYTNFSGTSAAAPVVSGIVALMLEANSNLGYRDVQKILALSAWHPDNQDWKSNGASNLNLGGLKFNDNIGFGLVDAYSAVQIASTWTESNTAINEVSDSARSFNLGVTIPDGNGAYSKTFQIDNAMQVSYVELGVDLRSTRLGDLIIQLISPNGTISTLMDRPTVNAEQPFGLSGADSGVPNHLVWDFSSVQFMGEQSVGNWTIKIQDVRAEELATLNSLSLRVYGERSAGNDTYVFTDEGFRQQATLVLQDESGIDIINAAAVTHDMLVNLAVGEIASSGVTDKIAAWTVIENVVTGSGNDNLVGNDAANWLRGQAGNDTLQGGRGNDTLDGGVGKDTAVYAGAMAEFGISWNPTTKEITVVDNKISNGDEGTDVLRGIERIVFSDGEMSLAGTVGNRPPVANATVFDHSVMVSKGMAIQYDLPDNAFTDADITGGSSPALQISASNATGGELPAWLSYDPVTQQFTGVPPADLQGQIKVLVQAIDDFGQMATQVLTFQLGDNQAPVVDLPKEMVLNEDAGLVSLAITNPVDPEGKLVTVTVQDIPTLGVVLRGDGTSVVVGQKLSANELDQLHYQTAADANGNAGYFHYQATDADGVISESSVKLFIDPVNDAPRFIADSQLVIKYPSQNSVTLDVAHPTDPEGPVNLIQVSELPSLGLITLDGQAIKLSQALASDQLDRLVFTLNENVNGPIGSLGIQAIDPQGLATTWKLGLTIQGEQYSSVGTTANDSIYGSIGPDTLSGMAGNDILAGNAGDDRLLGGAGDDTLLGGSGNDALDGGSGNDLLDGGTGNDIMAGGPGNDYYIVDSLGDQVVEVLARGAGGNDTIETSVSYTAPVNVENLIAKAGFAIGLTGNELDNQLSGNELANVMMGGAGADTLMGFAGNDTLDGGTGVDRLAGGLGDDLYRVDSRSDLILEYQGEGNDTVEAHTSYTLPSNVENLTLLEGGDWAGGGNSLNNIIIGNSGNNTLSGGLGADTLKGGLGNDTYVLNDALDTIIDTGGVDTVRSSLSYTLPIDIERLELIGLGNITGMGNSADNILIGNPGDNYLEGGAGIDILTGGAGGDGFYIAYNGAGKSADTVTDFTTGDDLLMLDLASFGVSASSLGLLSSGMVGADSFVSGVGAKALDPNDYLIYDTAKMTLYFDADGSGAGLAVEAVKLIGVSDLHASDIYLSV